ncbi:MAG: putative sulfate exporter family transporter [Anaerolineales bacterium]|nr:putative sulfate exporter family transporter [Anaerolineales bacterium]
MSVSRSSETQPASMDQSSEERPFLGAANQTPQSGSSRYLQQFANVIPGFLLAAAIGGVAFYLSTLHHSLDALVLGILMGMTIKAILGNNPTLQPGIQFSVKLLIPVGIIAYGTNIDFSRFATLPLQIIIFTLLCMVLFFVIIYSLNRVLWKLRPKLSALLAYGSAVCGASAIAVLTPSIDAEPEDTSVSLLAVTAVALLGVMTYPLLKEFLQLSDEAYAVLSGSTLHQTGTVRLAIAGLNQSITDFALAVKTIRIVMLAPIAVFASFLHRGTIGAARQVPASGAVFSQFIRSLGRVWFLLPFIIVGVLISFVPSSRTILQPLKTYAPLIFATTLTSIGLTVDIDSVINTGSRPLVAALAGWLGVVLFFLITFTFILGT